ncbi:glycosyltransferase family 4 protein [Nanoarchaeota archaeon]
MKKVLITSDCFLPRWDGIARFLDELLPELKGTFKITVLAPDFGKIKRIKGIKYIRFPTIQMQFGDIYFTKFNYRKIKSIVEKQDIVFNQTIGPIGMSALTAASRLNKPIIQYVHSIDWELASKGVKRFQKLVLHAVKYLARHFHNKSSLLLVPSRAVEDKISENKITSEKKLLPLGVNTKYFSPKNLNKSKKKLGIHPDTFIIGFVGRIGREKDLGTLYKAFKKIKKTHKCKLLIVGEGLTDEIPKDTDVILAGSQLDVRPYLNAMDVFVLPSLTETSSLATMEAMACGLPVIVTPVGNIPEYVQDGHNGLIFSRKDVDALIERIHKLIDDPELRKVMGKNARKTIVKNYPWHRTVKRIKKVLLDIKK